MRRPLSHLESQRSLLGGDGGGGGGIIAIIESAHSPHFETYLYV